MIAHKSTLKKKYIATPNSKSLFMQRCDAALQVTLFLNNLMTITLLGLVLADKTNPASDRETPFDTSLNISFLTTSLLLIASQINKHFSHRPDQSCPKIVSRTSHSAAQIAVVVGESLWLKGCQKGGVLIADGGFGAVSGLSLFTSTGPMTRRYNRSTQILSLKTGCHEHMFARERALLKKDQLVHLSLWGFSSLSNLMVLTGLPMIYLGNEWEKGVGVHMSNAGYLLGAAVANVRTLVTYNTQQDVEKARKTLEISSALLNSQSSPSVVIAGNFNSMESII